MFRYHKKFSCIINTLKTKNYIQSFGMLFRSDIFSVRLTFYFFLVKLKKKYKPMLCYEIFKKWPLLSLFIGCIRKELP